MVPGGSVCGFGTPAMFWAIVTAQVANIANNVSSFIPWIVSTRTVATTIASAISP